MHIPVKHENKTTSGAFTMRAHCLMLPGAFIGLPIFLVIPSLSKMHNCTIL